MIFDKTQCSLGEGALWHPRRLSLFWFDINKMTLFERGLDDTVAQMWQFDEHVSAAGWVDENSLLVASETALFRFHLPTASQETLVQLEADNPDTRSNDGRADPQGGFWIGTMGKQAQMGAGAIYRYYKGELRLLYDKVTISNAICFAPDGRYAYFCDTKTQKIMKVTLDAEGWPSSAPETHINTAPFHPDGAVVDREGNLWNAQWGAGRVACYTPKGEFVGAITFPATQISCPAFGGLNADKLFATSARENMDTPSAEDGCVFVENVAIRGQQEHAVILNT